MIYKDSTFEISENQVKFKNKTVIIFLAVFTPVLIWSLILSKGNAVYTYIGATLGAILGLYFLRLLTGMYLKNTINLSDIEYVRIHTWDNSIDKDRRFLGTGQYKYHFPTGINKKKNPQVILLHIKDRRAVVGFVPEIIENVFSVLNEKGIKITTKTHGDVVEQM